MRANLRAASAEVGEGEALRRFGDLDAVAAEYRAAAGRGGGDLMVDRGVVGAVWTLFALLVLAVLRVPTFGMVDTFDAFTGQTSWHLQLWRFGELSGDLRTETLLEATVYSFAFVLLPLLAFVVRSRAWRPAVRRSGPQAGQTSA